jgi:vacuolar-type H+-ATPase subunit E/Vma4
MLKMNYTKIQKKIKNTKKKKKKKITSRATERVTNIVNETATVAFSRIRTAVTPLCSAQKSPDVVTNIAIHLTKSHTLYEIHGKAIYGIM